MAGMKDSKNLLPKLVVGGLLVLVLCGLSFWGGIAYQKGHDTNTVAQGTPTGAAASRFRNRARPAIGTVSGVSGTSITVQTQDGTTKTFTVTSATEVTDNGAASAIANVQTGDTVAVIVSTTNTNQATRILLNPSFGGGFGGGSQATQTPNTQTN